jgi:ABC-2 family transporter
MRSHSLRIFGNPEFVRHLRAELRPARATAVVIIIVVVCILVGLSCWTSVQRNLESARYAASHFDGFWVARLQQLEKDKSRDAWLLSYKWLLGIQGVVLTFWTLLACTQSISGERERKTWDFQRITRLTPAKMVGGKLLGEPVLAYFTFLVSLPAGFAAGLLAGVGLVQIIEAYVFLATSALFLGIAGLWVSMLSESRSRGVSLIGALGIYFLVMASYAMRETGLPGVAAFSPLTGISSLFGVRPTYYKTDGSFFGYPVPWLALSLFLEISCGAWLALMLVRNLKRDYAEIRPLSRSNALAGVAYVNLVIYALMRPDPIGIFAAASYLVTIIVIVNAIALLLIGLATLSPYERLSVWWRERRDLGLSGYMREGLPLPWVALSAAMAYVLLIFGLAVWRRSLPFNGILLASAAVQFAVLFAFLARDVLFIQWCNLTRLRQPMVKGVLYLCLYYVAAVIISTVFYWQSQELVNQALALLTPAEAFYPRLNGPHFPSATYVGMALQLAIVVVLMVLIAKKLKSAPEVTGR